VERIDWLNSLVNSSYLLKFFIVELPGVIAHLGYNKYLAIVVPGTVIGDMLLEWMSGSDSADAGKERWDKGLYYMMAGFLLAIIVFLHTGLEGRWMLMTPIGTLLAMGFGSAYVFSGAGTSTERLLQGLFRWAFFWLMLGLLFESTEGGIKKDPSNRSYYFTALALAILLLMFFIILIDILKYRKTFHLLIASGQNPMIAYAGIRALMAPLVHFKFIPWKGEWIHLNWFVVVVMLKESAWPGFVWAFLKTVFVAWSTSIFTRLKIVWRT
jgi:hypothetical protein